jgi:hypothetical protein
LQNPPAPPLLRHRFERVPAPTGDARRQRAFTPCIPKLLVGARDLSRRNIGTAARVGPFERLLTFARSCGLKSALRPASDAHRQLLRDATAWIWGRHPRLNEGPGPAMVPSVSLFRVTFVARNPQREELATPPVGVLQDTGSERTWFPQEVLIAPGITARHERIFSRRWP